MTVGDFVINIWEEGMARQNVADIPRLHALWQWTMRSAPTNPYDPIDPNYDNPDVRDVA